MKKSYIYILLITLTYFISGCYEDEGNYDYHDFIRVDSITNIEETYNVSKFDDVLLIEPKLNFSIEGDTTRFKYEWGVSLDESTRETQFVILSNEKNFNGTIDNPRIPFRNLRARYTVTDTVSNVKTSKNFHLNIGNSNSFGDYYLYEENSNGELLILKENGTIIRNLYQSIGEKPLIGNPLKMALVKYTNKNLLAIFTDHYPEFGGVLDMTSFKFKNDANKIFYDGQPETIDVSKMDRLSLGAAGMIINGDFHYYKSKYATNYAPMAALTIPTVPDGDNFSNTFTPIIHQRGTGQFFYKSYNFVGYVRDEANSSTLPAVPGKCLYFGRETGSDAVGSIVTARAIIKDNETIKDCIVRYTDRGYTSKPYYVSSADVPYPDYYSENTLWCASESVRYFYFTKDNVVYKYNYDAIDDEPIEFITLPEGVTITLFEMQSESDSAEDKNIVIATYNEGDVNSGSVYYYTPQGELERKYENISGKIVDRIVME